MERLLASSPPRRLLGRGPRLRTSSDFPIVLHESPLEIDMSDPLAIPTAIKPSAQARQDKMVDNISSPSLSGSPPPKEDGYFSGSGVRTPNPYSTPGTPGLVSRSPSFSSSFLYTEGEDDESMPPLDRLTVFDFLENLALPQRLERLQSSLATQTEKVRRQQQRLKSSSRTTKDKLVDQWKRRVPTPDEQLDKYRRRMRDSVDRFGKKWTDAQAVTIREKAAFIAGVLNILISGFLVGAYPEWFHIWYTAQLCYFYPIRFYTYHKRGYHYFLVDLCYFVNLLLILSIWAFPQSKRLFISTFCLAFGNNAVAIAMWRNSLVFHSLDKVTSLFIHIMPCVTIHCLVHLIPTSFQATRFPAIYNIKTSSPTSPEHYSLASMIFWATIPYLAWQLSYHFLITVRRRDKIAAGRPTSYTWLRRSYAPTWIGKSVLSLPEYLQEPAFMGIQYCYALLTMMPAPLWFWFRWPSAIFLMVVFTLSTYNGAVYYIDVFGTRFQKELEQLKRDVGKWQVSPEISGKTPLQTPRTGLDSDLAELTLGAAAVDRASETTKHQPQTIDGDPPLLDEKTVLRDAGTSTGVQSASEFVDSNSVRARAGLGHLGQM